VTLKHRTLTPAARRFMECVHRTALQDAKRSM
jgi:hypothetical protein